MKKRNKIRWNGKGGDKCDGANLSFERQKVMGRRGCMVVWSKGVGPKFGVERF
jgi:hypothetical protein